MSIRSRAGQGWYRGPDDDVSPGPEEQEEKPWGIQQGRVAARARATLQTPGRLRSPAPLHRSCFSHRL
jgi:hypothetical protein